MDVGRMLKRGREIQGAGDMMSLLTRVRWRGDGIVHRITIRMNNITRIDICMTHISIISVIRAVIIIISIISISITTATMAMIAAEMGRGYNEGLDQ